MAAIQHFTDETTAAYSNNSDSNWNQVTGASLSGMTGNKKYLIIVNALHGQGSRPPSSVGMRVVHGSTTFASSEHVAKYGASGSANHAYTWWTVFTQPATPEAITVEAKTFQGLGAAWDVFADEVRIHAINLTDDLVDGTDYKFAEDTSGPTAHTTSLVDRASITWTPGTASEDWLLLGRSEVIVDDIAINYEMNLLLDGSEAGAALTTKEGRSLVENIVLSKIGYVASLSAASHTLKVQTRDDASGTQNDYDTSAVFALRMDAFESHSSVEDANYDTSAADTWEEAATVTHTPDTTGDHMVIGASRVTVTGGTQAGSIRLQFDGTSDPTNWETAIKQGESTDGTDRPYVSVIVMRSIADTGDAIDLDTYALNAGQSFQTSLIVAFSMELVVAPVETPKTVSGVLTFVGAIVKKVRKALAGAISFSGAVSPVKIPAASTEQEGFRFGTDDGSESAHGWEAAQDTIVTMPAEVTRLLRMLINATGDPASTAYKLQYRKVGDADSEWEDLA